MPNASTYQRTLDAARFVPRDLGSVEILPGKIIISTDTDAAAPHRTWTDAELMALPDDGFKRELINGEIVMSPAGSFHGDINAPLTTAVGNHVYARKLGRVFEGQTGFKMKNGDVFSPDISFVAKERLRGMKHAPVGFFQGAPDLAVEVLSPDDTLRALDAKLAGYFQNGARLVWVINPVEQTVLVYRTPQPEALLRNVDTLDGQDVLPGFTCLLSELFAEYDFDQ